MGYSNAEKFLEEFPFLFKFVLLDCRSWREHADTAPGKAEDVLGTEQLEWLRGELLHDRKYTIVCSSEITTSATDRTC